MSDKATGGTDPASCLIALTGRGDAPDGYYGKDEPVMGIRLRHLSVGTAIVAAIVAVSVPASAVVAPPQPGTRAGSNTEMTMSGTGPGQSVTGFIAIAPFDPLSGYPPSNPSSGFAPKDEGFAGVITGAPAEQADGECGIRDDLDLPKVRDDGDARSDIGEEPARPEHAEPADPHDRRERDQRAPFHPGALSSCSTSS